MCFAGASKGHRGTVVDGVLVWHLPCLCLYSNNTVGQGEGEDGGASTRRRVIGQPSGGYVGRYDARGRESM
jgi:hypothetical protein